MLHLSPQSPIISVASYPAKDLIEALANCTNLRQITFFRNSRFNQSIKAPSKYVKIIKSYHRLFLFLYYTYCKT